MGHECGLLYFVLEERDLLHSLHISSNMLQANIQSSECGVCGVVGGPITTNPKEI
jgi:hypothetical protein